MRLYDVKKLQLNMHVQYQCNTVIVHISVLNFVLMFSTLIDLLSLLIIFYHILTVKQNRAG